MEGNEHEIPMQLLEILHCGDEVWTFMLFCLVYFLSSKNPHRQRRLELVIIVMELLQLKVAESSYNIISWKVREQKFFQHGFCYGRKY